MLLPLLPPHWKPSAPRPALRSPTTARIPSDAMPLAASLPALPTSVPALAGAAAASSAATTVTVTSGRLSEMPG
jgi:hypothetical protein